MKPKTLSKGFILRQFGVGTQTIWGWYSDNSGLVLRQFGVDTIY